MAMVRTGAALGLGLALAGCGEPTIAWQVAKSPGHPYVATAEYDAPVLERKDSYVFLESDQWFSRRVIYQSPMHDCIVLKWTGPRALTVSHLGGLPITMEPVWKPIWGGESVRITYRSFTLSGIALPPECLVTR
ncbi:MAG: hypothetical protein JWN66_3170 [Sphingomonas bacterium]|uniref:hypothetical protein n=1 Tax=Sphingomonas bacterium TaxID=1895847 RepID=UPI0026258559|nr:hypothetical protein [Sphingomonas bacterium]MDB5706054.1 hypothetical protein [Sphingomonas bacterium]